MDWTETIADAKDGMALQKSHKPSEEASMWQSLSFGANYKAAYCVAVCPAGEDVIGPYIADKGSFKRDVLKPLTEKARAGLRCRGNGCGGACDQALPAQVSAARAQHTAAGRTSPAFSSA